MKKFLLTTIAVFSLILSIPSFSCGCKHEAAQKKPELCQCTGQAGCACDHAK